MARDKIWFTSYQSYDSQLSSVYDMGAPVPVIGIGTVKFTVIARPDSFTVFGTSTIKLHNVLHVPSYICNVLGRPLGSVFQINLEDSDREGDPLKWRGLSLHGREIAHFRLGLTSFLSLAVLPPEGMKFGPSPFTDKGGSYVTSCHWPNEERARWQAVHDQALREHAPPLLSRPYSLAELEYLNKHWGTEFRFLTQHRLRLHEERDRSEGRRIVRALMRGKDLSEKDECTDIQGSLSDYLLPDRDRGFMRTRDPSAPRAPFF